MTPAPTAAGGPHATDVADGPVAVRQLALLAGVQVLAMATWFAASAVAPALRDAWSLTPLEATLLTSAVQVGFVVGALASAATTLADLVDPPRLVAVGALLAALTTAGVALVADGFAVALLLRIVTGMALALVYPVGMTIAVSWFEDRRGVAVGVLVGALTVGSVLPHLLGGTLGEQWRPVLLVAAAAALARGGPAARGSGSDPSSRGRRRSRPERPWASCASARPAWRSWATSATCGSCTRCGPGCRSSSPRGSRPGARTSGPPVWER